MASFEVEAIEGELVELLVVHRYRERSLRNAKLVEHKLKYGSLACEACGFDFSREFSPSVEYAEIHHVLPLAAVVGTRLTKLEDLVVLCANCRRVAHLDPKQPRQLSELRKMRRWRT